MRRITTDPSDPRLRHGVDETPGPQSDAYLVLPDAERAKGFVRPVRLSYKHVRDGVRGCGTVTTMGVTLAETYARDPTFYGSTYCVACRMHLRVGEFRWEPDGSVVGS